jgi:hypothetical protein
MNFVKNAWEGPKVAVILTVWDPTADKPTASERIDTKCLFTQVELHSGCSVRFYQLTALSVHVAYCVLYTGCLQSSFWAVWCCISSTTIQITTGKNIKIELKFGGFTLMAGDHRRHRDVEGVARFPKSYPESLPMNLSCLRQFLLSIVFRIEEYLS